MVEVVWRRVQKVGSGSTWAVSSAVPEVAGKTNDKLGKVRRYVSKVSNCLGGNCGWDWGQDTTSWPRMWGYELRPNLPYLSYIYQAIVVDTAVYRESVLQDSWQFVGSAKGRQPRLPYLYAWTPQADHMLAC